MVMLTTPPVLDPRISYTGLKMDYSDEPLLDDHLEKSMLDLRTYFDKHYLHPTTSIPARPSTPPPTSSAATHDISSPQKVNFMARFQMDDDNATTDELTDYFKLPRESFSRCHNPIQWWVGRRSQFPNLFRLARDIFSIPGMFFPFLILNSCSHTMISGSAVAVERVFSGGRDTISLRRASLQPDTICMLMLVKHHLRLLHSNIRPSL